MIIEGFRGGHGCVLAAGVRIGFLLCKDKRSHHKIFTLRHEQQSVKAATPSRNFIELDLQACFKRLQGHSLQFVT